MLYFRTFLICLAVGGCLPSFGEPPTFSPPRGAGELALSPLSEDQDSGGGALRKAQDAVRMRPSARNYLDLAALFMRRRRETSAPVFMLYARDAIEAALRLEPQPPRGRLMRAMVHQFDHEFDAARTLAEELLQEDEENADAHLVRGDAALEQGDYGAAAEAYQAAVDLRPDLRSYNRAAHLRWISGDADAALDILELAMDSGSASDPQATAWCLADAADIYRATGRLSDSLSRSAAALELAPHYLPALMTRARTLGAQKRLGAAVSAYQEALRILPTVDGLVEGAEVALEAGRLTRGRRWLEQARALARDDPRPLAHFLARRGWEADVPMALSLSKRALGERMDIASWDTRGLALIRAGRWDEAEAALNHAQAQGSTRPELQLHRALLDASRGDHRAAERHLKAALRVNPHVDRRLVQELELHFGVDAVAVEGRAQGEGRAPGSPPVRRSP